MTRSAQINRTVLILIAWALLGCAGQSMTSAPVAQPVEPLSGLERLWSKAIEQIIASSKSDDPFLRANAVEAAQYLPNRLVPIVHLAANDVHPAVRFAALVAIGRQHLKTLAPIARPHLSDSSQTVRAAAMFALRRCDQPVDITPLASMLASADPTVRGNAAMLLGWLGDPSAIPMLKDMARVPEPRLNPAQDAIVRLQFAEAVCHLGDDSVIGAIRAALYSQFDELRVMAVTMMGDLGDRRFEVAIEQLLAKPPVELQLAAAATLAKFGRGDGFNIVLQATQSPIPTVRSQAALALGLFKDEKMVDALASLLDDPVEQVRLAAAAAVVKASAGSAKAVPVAAKPVMTQPKPPTPPSAAAPEPAKPMPPNPALPTETQPALTQPVLKPVPPPPPARPSNPPQTAPTPPAPRPAKPPAPNPDTPVFEGL